MSARPEKWFFLRGLVREAGHWGGFLERFNAAFPEREAIPLEIPGNGMRFQERSPLSVTKMAEAARADFLRLRGEENYLFALSLGGMIGLEWMHRWPHDFRSAVLVNTSVRGLSPLHHRLRPQNYFRVAKMMLLGNPSLVERNILEMTSRKKERFEELEAAWVKIQAERPVSAANAVRQLLAATRFHPPKNKPEIPILVLNGGGDRLVSPRCSSDLARHWGLDLKVHPTAGHDLTLDEPEWVIEQLRNFGK